MALVRDQATKGKSTMTTIASTFRQQNLIGGLWVCWWFSSPSEVRTCMIYASLASDSCVLLTLFHTEWCRLASRIHRRASQLQILANDLRFEFQIFFLTFLKRSMGPFVRVSCFVSFFVETVDWTTGGSFQPIMSVHIHPAPFTRETGRTVLDGYGACSLLRVEFIYWVKWYSGGFFFFVASFSCFFFFHLASHFYFFPPHFWLSNKWPYEAIITTNRRSYFTHSQ